jgi:predicted transposase/invertase (TIGR01784 family)
MGIFINPASDIFIRYLWGSEKNKKQTLSFINGVMQDSHFPELVSLEINNPFNLKSFEEEKDPEYILTDHLMLHFLELPKFQKTEKALHPKLYNWLYFLLNEGKEEDETMKILLKEDEDIKKAHEEYRYFSRDEKMKQIYEARHKRKLDELSALYEAEQKGKLEGKLEAIVGMYKAGVSIDIIAKGMDISVDEVRQILSDRDLLTE